MPAQPIPIVSFRDVTIARGGHTVLRNVSLDIADGAFIGVLGANGAGKTTLLRAVLGLLPPQAGTLQVLGAAPARGNPAIGYLPQLRGDVASAHLTGWDFVASAVDGHRLGLPWLGRRQRTEVDRALDLVGARALSRRALGETSGGEQQRLLLAQALVGRPRLLLLDEPLMNLDPRHQQDVVALVKSLQTSLRITVLFTAHELNPLLGAMDQVLYLGQSQAEIGTVDEVITAPVLSRLYGTDIEVLRLGGRIFVLAGSVEVERDDHRHHAHHHA
jgi:zinc/manganese transport system ATP-binding protein